MSKSKKVNLFEKMVFLEMTYKQLWKIPGHNKDYWNTYKSLSIKERDLIYKKIFHEIHKIWSYINSKNIDGTKRHQINSVLEYHNNIEKVSEIILQVSIDYDISLKSEMSEEFKKAITDVLGKDYLDSLLKGE